MLALEFKWYKFDTDVYYFIDKETKELVIAIVYVNDICFIGLKDSPFFLELKQKFKWNGNTMTLEKPKSFCHNYKDWKIFVDQSEYLNKVLACFNIVINPTSTLLPLDYVFKPNDK